MKQICKLSLAALAVMLMIAGNAWAVSSVQIADEGPIEGIASPGAGCVTQSCIGGSFPYDGSGFRCQPLDPCPNLPGSQMH